MKNEEEILLLRKAAQIVDKGLQAGLRMMKPGVTEYQLYAEVLYATQAAGSDGPPFFGMCSSGKRTLEGFLLTDRKFRRGDPVMFDVGTICHGYQEMELEWVWWERLARTLRRCTQR